MADEYNTSTNWWDRSRFDSGSSSSSSTSGLSFAWPTELRSSMESSVQTPLSDSSVVSHDTQKLQQLSIEDPENLQLMGLGLSSPAIDYQSLLRGREKQEAHHHHHGIGSSQIQWRPERVLFNAGDSSNRGFSLDQPQFSPHGSSSDSTVTCQSFQSMDSSSIVYGGNSNMFQGMLGSDQYGANYGNEMLPNSSNWCSNSKMVPAFLRTSPSNLQQNPTQPHLQFSNNAPFWNASATNIADHIRPGFFPPQPQFASTSFEEKPKVQNISEVREAATVAKKSGSETSTGTTKRPRNESQSTLPPFKVKKEKMGDRITALQQLVSPFGKTDTASVLSEALDYIKFLHEQVSVLSTPYMKNGAPIHHHQQSSDKNKEHEGHKQQDLKSRGLCLVPVSSTFPVTHETVDFWTPTFGGTFR